MRNRIFTAGAGAAAIAAAIALAGPAQAAEGDAQLSVLHGVPGLTVDVWVNGDRTLDDFTPGSLAGPLALPAGAYELAITASDAADASAAVIGPVSVTLAANGNYTAVANLDAAGNPTANLFTNDVSQIEAGKGKLTVRHTAAAPRGGHPGWWITGHYQSCQPERADADAGPRNRSGSSCRHRNH
jgi:hypothetical protein